MAGIRPYFLSTDHYGLVVSTCDFLGIQKFIDERIPKTSNNQKLTYGQLFVCMLVNALSYVSKPLYKIRNARSARLFVVGILKFSIQRR